jgi:hypothetical protein
MNCGKCRATLPDDSAFCPKCGAKQSSAKDPRPDWGCLLSIAGAVAGAVIGLAAQMNLLIMIPAGLVGGAIVVTCPPKTGPVKMRV